VSGFVRSEAGRAKLEAWYRAFRDRIGVPFTERDIKTRFGPTHVISAGPEDAPPVILLHGAMATSAHALVECGPLVDSFRVHAVDVIGQSFKGAEIRLSLTDGSYADFVSDIFAGLGISSAHVFGVSAGGFVALQTAKRYPALISKLVLVVPAGVVNGSALKGFVEVGWPMMLYRIFPSEARLRRFFLAIFSNWDEDWAHYLVDAMKHMKVDLRVPPLFSEADLAGFTKPVLVIAAEHDLSFPGVQLLQRAAVLFPHAEKELLAGSRHSPPTTDEGRRGVAAHITRFLKAT